MTVDNISGYSQPSSPAAASLRLLLIDDEEPIRTSVSAFLSKMGYEVLTAADGEEGLRLFEEQGADIIISDIQMPDLSGIDLLRRLREQAADVEIILITGHGDVETAVEALREGAFDFFSKPVQLYELTASLERTRRYQAVRREKERIQEKLETVQRSGILQLQEDDVIGESDAMADVMSLVDMTRLKGQRSLLVDGDVIGDSNTPCRIEVSGDAIITGRVTNAHVTAENVRIDRDASECTITAGCDVVIGGSFDGGRVIAGNYDDARKRIESCRSTLERGRERAESLERRVSHDEKRMDKACHTLRIPLDFNVGRIVTHAEGRVSVDLRSFYRSLDERREARLELALTEFFAKGVVGVVARTNRKYLIDFPAREKVFMQLLRSLRELFLIVGERDSTLQSVEAAERKLETLSANLTHRQPRVAVGGRVAPMTEIEFILPRIVPLNDGSFDFAHQAASLSVNVGAGFGETDVVVKDAAGARSARDMTDLHSVLFRVNDGRVCWDAVASPEVAAAQT